MEPNVSKKEMKMRTALKVLRGMDYFAWYSASWNGISYCRK